MKYLVATVASLLSFGAGSAYAQCVTVEPVLAPQIRLDPLDASGVGEMIQPIVLTFRRATVDSAAISLRYQIVDEDSFAVSRVGLSQGPTVEWQAEGSSREIGAFRSEAYSLLRSGQAALGANDAAVQRTVYLRLTNPRDDIAAGIYREQFSVRYWCGDDDSIMPQEAQGAIAVAVAVPNVLSANIAGASTRGEIDFMDFSLPSRSLQVSVRSTGPYRISARSLNGGALVREGSSSSDEADRIGYVVVFDGVGLDVDGVSARPMARAGLLGRQDDLQVSVGDVREKRAGAYADTLLLTLSPAN